MFSGAGTDLLIILELKKPGIPLRIWEKDSAGTK
jgi:hypothetical protein